MEQKFMEQIAASAKNSGIPGRTNDLAFKRIVVVSTALGFATVLGTAACLEHGAGQGFDFRWHWRAVFWMALGVGAAVHLWRLVWRAQTAVSANAGRRLARFCVVLLISALVIFVYPILFVSGEHFSEVLTGLSLATVVLTFVGWMIYRMIRGFIQNDAANQVS